MSTDNFIFTALISAIVMVTILGMLPFSPTPLLKLLSKRANPFCRALGLYGFRRARRHAAILALAAALIRHRFRHYNA
jgi:hypothetical protein